MNENTVTFKDEILTDNEALDKCLQCKKCKFRNDGTAFSQDYRSACCIMYPYPGHKPLRVLRNTGFCDYRKER